MVCLFYISWVLNGHPVRWSQCTNTVWSGFGLIMGQTPMELVEFWTSTEGADIHVGFDSKVLYNLRECDCEELRWKWVVVGMWYDLNPWTTLCLAEWNGVLDFGHCRFETVRKVLETVLKRLPWESCQSKAAAEKFERNIQKRLAALQSKFLELLFDGSSDYFQFWSWWQVILGHSSLLSMWRHFDL